RRSSDSKHAKRSRKEKNKRSTRQRTARKRRSFRSEKTFFEKNRKFFKFLLTPERARGTVYYITSTPRY
ncbi:MAG: hypothetical protein IIY32_06415, partial [Thermoguttaceae bacterium]|nr:hypothetical protein [Thermoguttaceae bacterium]